MSIWRIFSYLKGKNRVVPLVLTILLVSGCSSSMSRIQTWQGEPADPSGVAVLETPGEIRVLRVNDRKMSNFLMDDLALSYELLPGENQVIFTYKTIWAKKGVVRNGESKVHVVETAPLRVTLTAQAGETYRFRFEKPESRNEARTLAEDFSATVVNSSGQEVARAKPWDGGSVVSANSRTPAPEGGDSNSGANDSTTLDKLKTLWGSATDEEKRTFLRWAFE